MPMNVARSLAVEEAVGSEELEAAVHYLDNKLRDAALRDEPVPFLSYRNKLIFETTLKIRRSAAMSEFHTRD